MMYPEMGVPELRGVTQLKVTDPLPLDAVSAGPCASSPTSIPLSHGRSGTSISRTRVSVEELYTQMRCAAQSATYRKPSLPMAIPCVVDSGWGMNPLQAAPPRSSRPNPAYHWNWV